MLPPQMAGRGVPGIRATLYIEGASRSGRAYADMPCVKLLSRKYQCLVRQRC